MAATARDAWAAAALIRSAERLERFADRRESPGTGTKGDPSRTLPGSLLRP